MEDREAEEPWEPCTGGGRRGLEDEEDLHLSPLNDRNSPMNQTLP